jgi:transposase
MEASGHGRWFERLLGELKLELWIGDAAEIRTKRVRKQKTDRQDAQLILKLLLEDRFPRIWVPSRENRDLQQLLWHRQRMVQTRTRVPAQPAQPKADILATGADSGIANATVFLK